MCLNAAKYFLCACLCVPRACMLVSLLGIRFFWTCRSQFLHLNLQFIHNFLSKYFQWKSSTYSEVEDLEFLGYDQTVSQLVNVVETPHNYMAILYAFKIPAEFIFDSKCQRCV